MNFSIEQFEEELKANEAIDAKEIEAQLAKNYSYRKMNLF